MCEGVAIHTITILLSILIPLIILILILISYANHATNHFHPSSALRSTLTSTRIKSPIVAHTASKDSGMLASSHYINNLIKIHRIMCGQNLRKWKKGFSATIDALLKLPKKSNFLLSVVPKNSVCLALIAFPAIIR